VTDDHSEVIMYSSCPSHSAGSHRYGSRPGPPSLIPSPGPASAQCLRVSGRGLLVPVRLPGPGRAGNGLTVAWQWPLGCKGWAGRPGSALRMASAGPGTAWTVSESPSAIPKLVGARRGVRAGWGTSARLGP
jgi:hypothetical protein